MRSSLFAIALITVTLAAFELAAPVAAPAQHQAMQSDSTHVLLTLVDRLKHPDAKATIVRPVGPGAPDIILVTGTTTPADLNRAIQMLMSARHTFGPVVNQEMHAHVPAAEQAPSNLNDETQYLADLQVAEELDVPGLGVQRSLFVAIQERH